MTSEVDRQMVFKTTKVRTALRKDGSWIRKDTKGSNLMQPRTSPVKVLMESTLRESHSPSSKSSTPQSSTSVQDTPTLPEWHGRKSSSYVLSARKKIESEGVTGLAQENQPPKPVEINSTAAVEPPAAKSSEIPVAKVVVVETSVVTDPEVHAPVMSAEETTTSKISGVTIPDGKTPEEEAPVHKAPEVKAPVVETPPVKAEVKIPVRETSVAPQPEIKANIAKAADIKTSVTPVEETTARKTPEIKLPEVKETKDKTPENKVTAANAPTVKAPVEEMPNVNTPEIKAPDIKIRVAETSEIKAPEVRTPVVETSPPAISPAASAPPPAPCRSTIRSPRIFCGFCNTPVEGNVKISINNPPIVCHAECFKCAVCAKPLGDMLSTMFHNNGVIQCQNCFHLRCSN